MEYFNNILCVEGGWLYGEGDVMTFSNYINLTKRGQVKQIRRGCKGTPSLIAYESIPERFKQVIVEKWGNPYEQVKHNQFSEKIEADNRAIDFYRSYVLTDGRLLPTENQTEYATNAAIINTINKVMADRKAMRRALGGSTSKLWIKVSITINELDRKQWPHSLPTNYRKLKERVKIYNEEGYDSLIHKGFCNNNSEKISEEAKLWMLARWANQVERCATERQLLNEYNNLCEARGWKQLKNITTIHLFLFQPEIQELWWAHRYGELKAKEKFGFQHKTLMPTMRDSLWYSDGTKLNYFYLNDEGKVETCQVYEVMDVYSEVLLGYHISKTEDYEAQYMAYRMALQTSQHKPYQITYDNQGGHKKLENGEFLTKLAHLSIRTKPYNGKSKTIESAFGRFQREFLKKDWFFTGQNITTKKLESKANLEFILANKSNLPTLADVKALYIARRKEWNEAKHPKTEQTRIAMYKSSLNPDALKLNMMDMVDLFWILRKEPVTVTAFGISFTEKKQKHDYIVYGSNRLPDIAWLRKNIDRKVYIKYDPEDFSLIYIYEKDATGLRLITSAEVKVEVHRGKQEQEEWEAQYFTAIEADAKAARIATVDKMEEILSKHGMSASQQGLIRPAIKGVEKVARKKRSGEIGKVEKMVSNAVLIDEEEEINIYKMM